MPLTVASMMRVNGGLGQGRERRLFDPDSAPVYGVIALMLLIVAFATASSMFTFDAALVRDTGLPMLTFLIFAWLARWIGFPLAAAPVESVMLFLLIAVLAPCCAVIIAACNLPLADATLKWTDSLFFGFDRATFVPSINNMPLLRQAMVWIYNSFMVQPLALLLLLIWTGRSQRAWMLLTAWGIALLLAVTIFGFVPAYGEPPYVLDFIEVLRGARDGSVRTLDHSTLTGIITFPSFHAAGATLLAWGFAGFGVIATPLLILNAAMIVSALVVGGHNLVDLPAGVLVAVGSIWLAKRMYR